MEGGLMQKDSESYVFFSKLWDFGKYAASCEDKDMYLCIGQEILVALMQHGFDELSQPLNGFYKIMCDYHDISANEDRKWEELVLRCDEAVAAVKPELTECIGKVYATFLDCMNERARQMNENISRGHER
jgi:hypothetical protein